MVLHASWLDFACINLQHAHLTSVTHLTMTGVPLETGRTPHLSQIQALEREQPMKQQYIIQPRCCVDVPHQSG